MCLYVSSSYSLSSIMFSYILAQMPRHPPQPLEQSNPALLQEQRRVSHPIVQQHRTTSSSAFWATSMSHCRDRTVVYPLLLSSQNYLWMQMWNKPWFPFPYLHLKVNTEAMVLDSWWRQRKVFMQHKTCTGGYLLMKDLQLQFVQCVTHCSCVQAK